MTWILIVAIVYARHKEQAVLNASKVFDKIYTEDICQGDGFFDGIIMLSNESHGTEMEEDHYDAFLSTSSAGKKLITSANNYYMLTEQNGKMEGPPSIFDHKGNPISTLDALTIATEQKFNDAAFGTLSAWVVPAKAHY